LSDEENRLLEAIEQVRRDKHQPWRYISFTFLNGIAQGLGIALGAIVLLALAATISATVFAELSTGKAAAINVAGSRRYHVIATIRSSSR